MSVNHNRDAHRNSLTMSGAIRAAQVIGSGLGGARSGGGTDTGG